MEYIRRHSEIWAASLFVVFLSGIAYPTLHRIEHAVALELQHDHGFGHDHSDHDDAVENPYPDLTSDTCWICVRQLTVTSDQRSQGAALESASDKDRPGAPLYLTSHLQNSAPARAPPVVI